MRDKEEEEEHEMPEETEVIFHLVLQKQAK